MAQELINVGAANEKQGDTPFVFCPKINRNFTELYSEINNGKIGNRIIINDFSNFPEPMISDTEYYIGGSITIPTTLPASWANLPKNISFTGSVVASVISWGGVGALFSGADMERFYIDGVLLNAPNGTLYNITETTTPTIVNLLTASVGVCKSVGVINVFGLVMDTCNYRDVTQGLVTGDKNIVLNIASVAVTSASPLFVHVDFSLSTLSTLEIINNRVVAPSGAFAFKGLPNSVNVDSEQIGLISSCEILGGAVALSGITADDVGYDYRDVTGVIDSTPIGHCYIDAGDESTTAITSGVEVPVAGLYTQGSESSQSTSSATGVITMLNRVEKRGNVTVSMDIDKVGGGADSYIFRIKKIPISTGVAVDVEGVFTTKTMAGGGSDSFSISGPVRHITGDQFYVTVQSVGSNDDIIAYTQGFEVIN